MLAKAIGKQCNDDSENPFCHICTNKITTPYRDQIELPRGPSIRRPPVDLNVLAKNPLPNMCHWIPSSTTYKTATAHHRFQCAN